MSSGIYLYHLASRYITLRIIFGIIFLSSQNKRLHLYYLFLLFFFKEFLIYFLNIDKFIYKIFSQFTNLNYLPNFAGVSINVNIQYMYKNGCVNYIHNMYLCIKCTIYTVTKILQSNICFSVFCHTVVKNLELQEN